MTPESDYAEYRVLYLEDEPLIAFDTTQHLEELGFREVCTVYRLAQAEEVSEGQLFDLAIFDISVDRGTTSLALGKSLAARGTPVIFASGNGTEAQALRDAGHFFLGKPFSLAMLTQEIRRALRM